jgi:hypothetical protein
MADTDTTPTGKTYTELDRAYRDFNVALFDGELPGCLITLTRRRRSQGFVKLGQFASSDRSETTDEIGLNPQRFDGVPDAEIQATLVRLMCHQWRAYQYRPPKKAGYCDEVCAAKLESLGLVPTDTGKRGGRRTGSNVGHYIVEDGLFARVAAARKFVRDRLFYDLSKEQDPQAKTKNKSTFVCPACGEKNKYWGRPGLRWVCPVCGCLAIEEGAEPGDVIRFQLVQVVDHSMEAARADLGLPVASYERELPPEHGDALDWLDAFLGPPPASPADAPAPIVTDPPWPLQPPAEPAKRKRGRPKGSKNKPKAMARRKPKRSASYETPKRKRGRPKGSRNRSASIAA